MRTRTLTLASAVLLFGCIENQLNPSTDDVTGGDDDGTGPITGDGTADPCNGLDDNGNGVVDEGAPDHDGDGIADCVDSECKLYVPDAVGVGRDDACGTDFVVEDPWDLVIEWQWSGLAGDPTVRDVLVAPVVGNLTDDDGDGDVDLDDTPDVVFTAFDSIGFETGVHVGRLVVLDGATGRAHWSVANIWPFAGPTVADVDGDGNTEVVAVNAAGHPVAFDGKGQLKWMSTVTFPVSTQLLFQTSVADVDGDGTPEVLIDNALLRGDTGELITTFAVDSRIPWRMGAIGDVDLDGDQEIFLGNRAFDHHGNVLWSLPEIGQFSHFSAIVNADSDPEAEIVVLAAGRLVVTEHDGTVITRVLAGDDHPGAPCVADFDGDGEAEVTWASNSGLHQYNLDGTQNWTIAVDDTTNAVGGCSGYDFDGDGAYEILYADNTSFHLLDAVTGTHRFQWTGHASTTAWEYPTVADIDGDGSAEVIVASNDVAGPGHQGITVFGHAAGQWLEGGPTWHVHDFAVTNVTPDGHVPAHPTPPWQAYNVFRARPITDEVAVNLHGYIVDACWSGCEPESKVLVSVQVYNDGRHASPTSVPIALYGLYGTARELIAVQALPSQVPAGEALPGLVFEIEARQVGPNGLLLRVDDDGRGGGIVEECGELDNEAEWHELDCVEGDTASP